MTRILNCLMCDIQMLNNKLFDLIRMLNVKMIQISKVKLFDVRHSNDECQNDLNVDC